MVHNSLEKKAKKKKRGNSKQAKLDIISRLPEHLIDDILSHLPIKDAVRTSILSRNWRYKWATVPSLVFDDQCFTDPHWYSFEKKKFVRMIYDVLLLHNGPIRKFKIAHKYFKGNSHIDKWIVRISRSSIEELVLKFWEGKRYKPPSCLFNCQNLTRLELYNCALEALPPFKGLRNLKILNLKQMTIDQGVFENLICVCPVVEKLILVDIDGLTDLNIDAPNLQSVYAWSVFHDVSFTNTFNLTSISISFNDSIKHIHGEPKANEISSKILRFFVNLPHIQHLQVSSYLLEYLACDYIPSSLPNKCLDLNYLCIDLNFNDWDENKAFLCLLRSSPNLQQLDVNSWADEQFIAETCYFWRDGLWSSLFTHLRVVTLNYVSGVEPELEFIEFMLSNAPALERMAVKPASSNLRLAKEMLRFKRASDDLEIDYLDP